MDSYKQFFPRRRGSLGPKERPSYISEENAPEPHFDSPYPVHPLTPKSRRKKRELIMGPPDEFVAERRSRSDIFTRRNVNPHRGSHYMEPGRADFFTSTPRRSVTRHSRFLQPDFYASTPHRGRQFPIRTDSRADFFTSTPRRGPLRSSSSRNLLENRQGQRVSFDSDDGSPQFFKVLKDYRYNESGRAMTARDLGQSQLPRPGRRGSLHRARIQTDRPRQHQPANVAEPTKDQASKMTHRTAYNAAKPLKKRDFRAGGPLPEPSCSTKPRDPRKKPKPQEGVYDESGRQFNLSEYLVEGEGGGRPGEYYDTSGQAFDVADRLQDAAAEQARSYSESRQRVELSDYERDAPAAQPQVYDEYGQPFDLPQYMADCRRECRQPQADRGRDQNIYDDVERRSAQKSSEPAVCSYRESARPANISEQAEMPQRDRTETSSRRRRDAPHEAYDDPGRPLNLDNFARPQPKAQSQRGRTESESFSRFQPPASSTQSYAMPVRASQPGSFNQFQPTAFSTHTGLASQPGSFKEFQPAAFSTQGSQVVGTASHISAYGAQSPRPQTAPAAESSQAQRQPSFQGSYTARRQPSGAGSAGRPLHASREEFAPAVYGRSRDDVSRITEVSSEQFDSPRGMGGGQGREQVCVQQVPSVCEQRSFEATFQPSRPRVQQEQPRMMQQPCPDMRSAGTTTQMPQKELPPGGMLPCQTQSNECPNISQEQLVQFLQYGDLSQILAGEPLSSIPRSPLFNTLVKDNYHPGAIEDAVHGQIDFNRIAFDAVFANDPIPKTLEPEDVPMSLLEAFDLRIRYEQDLRENLERRREFCLAEKKKEAADDDKATENRPEKYSSSSSSSSDEGRDSTMQTTFWKHRDELKLASTIDIDLAQNYRDHPETDLTEALSCLFKAEKMNVFDKFVHVAEEAIREVPISDLEKTALKSACTFHVDMHKEHGKSQKTYKPIEVISYIGTTRPK